MRINYTGQFITAVDKSLIIIWLFFFHVIITLDLAVGQVFCIVISEMQCNYITLCLLMLRGERFSWAHKSKIMYELQNRMLLTERSTFP